MRMKNPSGKLLIGSYISAWFPAKGNTHIQHNKIPTHLGSCKDGKCIEKIKWKTKQKIKLPRYRNKMIHGTMKSSSPSKMFDYFCSNVDHLWLSRCGCVLVCCLINLHSNLVHCAKTFPWNDKMDSHRIACIPNYTANVLLSSYRWMHLEF